MLDGELHGNFSTHRMSQKHDAAQRLLFNEFAQVRGHDIVVENLAVRRSAVVTQIYGKDLVMSAETPTHRAPVIGGAEKSVQDNEGITLSYDFEGQLHIRRTMT